MKHLKISNDLSLPVDAVTQTGSRCVVLTCFGCGNLFQKLPCQIRQGQKRAFCSVACRRAHRLILLCVICGKTFSRMKCELARLARGKYCSAECRRRGVKTGTVSTCGKCGEAFYRKPSAQSQSAYCSLKCYREARAETAKSYPKKGSRHLHRIIAEKMVGRPLKKGEIVHHLDENKLNYNEGNLEILPSQSEHARRHGFGVARKGQ